MGRGVPPPFWRCRCMGAVLNLHGGLEFDVTAKGGSCTSILY
jgi:hypothetical protein